MTEAALVARKSTPLRSKIAQPAKLLPVPLALRAIRPKVMGGSWRLFPRSQSRDCGINVVPWKEGQ
jgi:hypothetical protein